MKTMIVTVMGGMLMASAAFAAGEGQGVVNRRQENQQDRIVAGEKNGSLTTRESNRLERREGAIAGEVARDRAANGGHLTAQEKAQVTRQQNRTSGAIYRQKHDGQVQK